MAASPCMTTLIPLWAGFCVAYLIFIKANISSLAPIPPNLAISITLLPLILLAQLRGVAALATFSLVADAAMISGGFGDSACPPDPHECLRNQQAQDYSHPYFFKHTRV